MLLRNISRHVSRFRKWYIEKDGFLKVPCVLGCVGGTGGAIMGAVSVDDLGTNALEDLRDLTIFSSFGTLCGSVAGVIIGFTYPVLIPAFTIAGCLHMKKNYYDMKH